MIILHETSTETDRTDAFRDYARRCARGEVTFSPLLLPPEERRLYVRRTLREDHQFRIENRPEGAQAKFDKLARSPFVFFRGTALLYYRDYAGTDLHLPIVFTIGDAHPENFGVMPNENGAPFFSVNDFDEACFAPFTYDVKRGATGFYLVAQENGCKKKVRRAVVRAWTEGYLQGLQAFARNDRERWHQFRLDNSPPMIRDLLESARQSRKDFLGRHIDMEKERFRPTDEIVPYSNHVADFQEAIDRYRSESDLPEAGLSETFFRVKDVAVKKDSGTASLGLDRYFILIDGPSDDPHDSLILEMKQARRPALYGLVPYDEVNGKHDGTQEPGNGEAGVQVVRAHRIHLAGGDPFYGHVTFQGHAFIVRERSPYKKDVDVDDLSDDDLRAYARICGETLAQTHARSDEDTGVMEGDAEVRILSSIRPAVFCDDLVRFAETAARRIRADYKRFKKDHALGAFDFLQAEE